MDEMREPTFMLLCALASGPKHGYAIRQDVEQTSGGSVVMRTGTLYAALDRLCAERLVERSGEAVVDGRVRHYYRLTEGGTDALQAAAERRRSQAKVAIRRLGAAVTV